ncbi:Pectinesterase inhibitor domain containing protein [Parasponia andersonii]|uniref:Pectinesterase inhibitor domain containing protein n=1 Tax=Parasponia andersonii TaxID=3476 RepID=A0A2P5BYE5_PARAD|nr:Pectinesterase inhibitor domain containing protein [Parasponia andersonii]
MEQSSFFHGLTILITLMIIQLTEFMIPSSASAAARPLGPIDANTEFIKTSCDATTYPELCFNTLSGYASEIQSSPQLLAGAALSATLKTVRSTSTTMSKLAKSRGLTTREAVALNDCVEELGDSVDELQRSIGEMGKKESSFDLQMSNIQTWVSAALTDEDTCFDGFSGNAMNGSVKTTVRGHIVNVAHMTSNALALVNHYALIHS